MSHTARLQASVIAVLVAGAIGFGAQGATAHAQTNTGGTTPMSASDCDSLRLLHNYFMNAFYQERDKGHYGNAMSNLGEADSLRAEAAAGGCKWAVSRPAPSSGIGPVAGSGTMSGK